jgi:hypothetical protein
MKQESSAGLLLLDSGNRPVYANAEAIRVFVYPENPAEIKSAGSYLAERIQTLALNGQDRTQLPAARDLISGRRRYLCRFFVPESDWKKGAVLTLAFLALTLPRLTLNGWYVKCQVGIPRLPAQFCLDALRRGGGCPPSRVAVEGAGSVRS